jgi:DNA-binding transcriptional regulator WhiA
MNNLNDIKAYYNKKPVEYIVKETFNLKEDNVYVPRFKLKDVKEINDLPINEPIKPSNEVLIKAIKYGMVFLITYKGAKDKHLLMTQLIPSLHQLF